MSRVMHFVVPFLVVAASVLPAHAEKSRICTDWLSPRSEVARVDSIRGVLESEEAFLRSRREAADAVEHALRIAAEGAETSGVVKASIEDVRILIDNALFDEALARAMKFAGLKDEETVQAFQKRLALVSEEQRMAFGEAVVRQYRIVIEDAFKWVDSERFDEVLKRWGLGEKQAFDLLTRWKLLEVTDFAELRLAAGVWSKTVSAESIVDAISSVKRTYGGHLNDFEEVLFTRIRKDFSEMDLAMNRGPIEDRAFNKRLRYLNVVGWLRGRLSALRNPKESVFLMFITGGPLVAIAAVLKDQTAVLSVVGSATMLVSLSPVISHFTKNVVMRTRDKAILQIYTIGQLTELRRWIARNPNKSKEVGFDGDTLLKSIEARIEELQKIRYAAPGR